MWVIYIIHTYILGYLIADIAKMDYCQIKLTEESEKAFIYAVKNQYWYKMYMDDLPIWGNVFLFPILKCVTIISIDYCKILRCCGRTRRK